MYLSVNSDMFRFSLVENASFYTSEPGFSKKNDNLSLFHIDMTYPHTEGQQAEIWPNGKFLNSCQGAIINFLTTKNIQ